MEARENPLLNSVILGKLMKELFELQPSSISNTEWLDDLKKFRLVCRKWQHESRKLWKDTRSITLTQRRSENEVEGNFLGEHGNRSGDSSLTITQFLEYFRADTYQLRSNPCENIKLKHCLIQASASQTALWEEVGPLIKTLTLEECSFHRDASGGTDEALRALFQSIVFEKTLNMKTLILKHNQFELQLPANDPAAQSPRKVDLGQCENLKEIQVGGILPVPWSEIFYRCPNLESITVLREKGVEAGHELRQEFLKEDEHSRWRNKTEKDALGICSYPSGIKHFHVLDKSFPFDWYNLARSFRAVHFPLETFTAQLRCINPYVEGMGGQSELRAVLTDIKETLEVLTVGCINQGRVTSIYLTTSPFLNVDLNSLRKLTLWGEMVGSLHFLYFMPNLENVHIDFSGFEKAPTFNLTVPRFRPTDIVAGTKREFPPRNLKLSKLTHFRADYPFTVQDLQTLREWMPKLKCFGAMLFDNTFKEVCTKWPKLTELSVLFGSHITEDGLLPSVTQLKWLRSFQLEAYCGKAKLAGASIYEGFAKLANLEFIKIYVSPRVTEEAEALLKRTVGRTTVMRNSEPGNHPEFPCCKRLEFDRKVFPHVVEFVEGQQD